MSEHHYCKGCYKGLICIGAFLAPFLLVVLRIFFGVLFVLAGLAKLSDPSGTAQFFASLNIPAPAFNAYLVGLVELVCGAALAVGFLSRLAAIPLIIVMVVAYATAHVDAVMAVAVTPDAIIDEKPFGFLLTAILVFCFGPGVISIDYLIEKACCNKCGSCCK